MKINSKPVTGTSFAYDGCHKIYICENTQDEQDAQKNGYTIHPISELENTYENSCDLRFIHNWTLDKDYVSQLEPALFQE